MAAKTKKKPTKAAAGKNGVPLPTETGDVMTLAEAAAYLRVAEEDLLRSAASQGLPGRKVGGEWRFLKSSLNDWLGTPPKKYSKEAFMALAGTWKDDPFVEEELKEIYRLRGRPMTEDGE
jgi:excisionase family DNA binding protein